MEKIDIYERFADHLSRVALGVPNNDVLVELLRENFTPIEAEAALAIPNRVIPLEFTGVDDISNITNLPKEQLLEVLENLTQRGLLLSGKTKDGKKGYALWQMGWGFPQAFHWKGEDTPYARKMAALLDKYYSNPKVAKEAYRTETKPYRYIPVGRTIETGKQGVYSFNMMENVIQNAKHFAVAHCACRVKYTLLGEICEHPTEVCLKFDDMALSLSDAGFAREISKEEALEIIKLSEEAGLVHFVDNAQGDIKHNCNCCGCACWNVGTIKRRILPRDFLMATYFIRKTREECVGCGECIEVCPVDALKLEDGFLIVDEDWCIGCGVCANACPNEAVKIVMRPDKTDQIPVANTKELHEIIWKEKGIR